MEEFFQGNLLKQRENVTYVILEIFSKTKNWLDTTKKITTNKMDKQNFI